MCQSINSYYNRTLCQSTNWLIVQVISKMCLFLSIFYHGNLTIFMFWVVGWTKHLKTSVGFQETIIDVLSFTKIFILYFSSIHSNSLCSFSANIWTACRPLPHIRNGHNLFDPPGNPVYARELLIFPNNKKECDIGEMSSMDFPNSASHFYCRFIV